MPRHETEASDRAAPASAAPARATVLETGVPLSQSVIWRLQRDFYAHRGLKAWTEDMVPSYITNNPFIAEIYAQIIAGFLDDCLQSAQGGPLSAEHPLRILELGAGTGKFSYLFLRKLTALLRAQRIAPELLRYSMADCSESLIADWRANRYLAEFVDSGILEFELLPDGEESQSPSAGGNIPQSTKPASGPLVVIANYVFDSLPQDAFIIKDGKISEALVTTTGGSEAGGVQPLGSLQLSFANASVSPERYANKSWNDMLELYRLRLPAATVLFPSAALALVQQLGQSSDGRMLVLAADKGITHEEDLALCQGPPALEFHASNHCFSQIVNFDAITKYFAGIEGLALVPAKHFTGLSICAFLERRPGDEFPSTRKAYETNLAAFGPDDLFALMTWLNAHLEEVSVSQALSLLRLTRWDTTAFLRLFPVIVRQLRNVAGERTDLRDAVLNTWANHYPVTPAENVLAFNCGVILLELRFFEDALAMFTTSEQFFGRSAATSYNLGLCAMGLGRTDQALAFLIDACTQDPAFEPARNLRLKLEQEKAQG